MEKYKLPKLNDRNNDLSKQWYVEYQFLHPETEKFERHREYISQKVKTGSERREKAAEIKDRLTKWLRKGGDPYRDKSMGSRPLLKVLEHLLSIKKTSTRGRSYSTYKSAIKIFSDYLEQQGKLGLRINELNLNIVLDYMDYLKLEKGLGNRSYNNMRMNLKVFMNEMERRGYLLVNPFKMIDPLPEEEPRLNAFTRKELDIVKNELRVEDFRLYCVAGLIFYCALRPAEIMRLRIRDLILDEKAIHISGNQTKNSKSDWICIPDDQFVEDLKSLELDKVNQDFFLFNRHLMPANRETAPTRIAERWRTWAKTKGITRHIYDLKHTVAGMSLDNNMPARDLQLHFRHSSLEITEKYLNRFRRTPGPGMSRYPKM